MRLSILAFILSAALQVTLATLTAGEPPTATHLNHTEPSGPTPTAPRADMVVSDIALSFAWSAVDDATHYDVEIARDSDFKEQVRLRRQPSSGYHRHSYRPKDLLAPGTYHWRVRAVLAGQHGGAWSATTRLEIVPTGDLLAEPVRVISPERPLFLMRSRVWDPVAASQHVSAIIPASLRGVIVVDDIALASGRVIERAQRYQDLGLDFVIWNNRCQVPLPTIEYLFQRFSHCIGTAEGEHFSGMYWEKGPEGNLAELDFVRRAWALCAKYGRLYFFADGDGGSFRWPTFAERERERLERYHRHLVLMFKTTNGDMALHSYGAIQGFGVAGTVANTGVWVDEWIWPISGFGKLGEFVPPEKTWERRRAVGTRECPWIYDIQMWLMGIASGTTVFHLESAHQWGRDGKGAAHYERVFLPFMRAVVERQLIPSRAAFRGQVRVAVTSDPALATGKHHKRYTGGVAYLQDLYALTGPGDQEFIPNNSRYGIVCLLPPWVTSLPGATLVVPQAQLADPAQARAVFDAAYPPRGTGEAFTWTCDGTVIVTNCHENRDLAQDFRLPLKHALVRGIGGTIGVHQYLVAKLATDGRSCWLQANGEYSERDLRLEIACTKQPRVTATPTTALAEQRWEAATGVLHLRLRFADGAAEIELFSDDQDRP